MNYDEFPDSLRKHGCSAHRPPGLRRCRGLGLLRRPCVSSVPPKLMHRPLPATAFLASHIHRAASPADPPSAIWRARPGRLAPFSRRARRSGAEKHPRVCTVTHYGSADPTGVTTRTGPDAASAVQTRLHTGRRERKSRGRGWCLGERPLPWRAAGAQMWSRGEGGQASWQCLGRVSVLLGCQW